jgi:hypothetical protein
MKKSVMVILALMLCTSSVFAYQTSWTGVYDPADFKIGGIYGQDISLSGFNQATDVVSSAYFTFVLYDDGDSSSERGEVRFSTYNLDDTSFNIVSDGVRRNYVANAPSTVYWGLLDDGSTNFDLFATIGDFMFDKVTLTAEGDRAGAAPVPEPATLLLLGAGLIGLAGYGRKKI